MPHEVIMPALGMAQESGLIVAWLKKPGEAVAEGEALMEVETDKATMEVEAQASGYLTDVRARAGESVPVGERVALISESPAAEGGNGAPEPDEAAAQAAEDLPEGRDVIMPALGMAQESGLIVAWHKEAGAEVAEGDVLLEVETDKATMEVEAERAGFLGAILAEAGDDVPVGQRIAILTDSAPAAPIRRKREAAAPAPAPAPEAPAEAAPAKAAPDAAPVSPSSVPRADGRILASPKARRLAAAQGLDLADLVAAGYAQPFHVADIETLRALPKARPEAAPAAPSALPSEVTAEVPADAFDGFCAWSETVHDPAPDTARLFAAFAAGALRATTGGDPALTVALGGFGALVTKTDPDLVPLSAALDESDAAPALIVRDLTDGAITGHRPGAAAVPVLSVTRRGNTLVLHLVHDETTLPQEAALALVSGMAGRIAQPLRHLL